MHRPVDDHGFMDCPPTVGRWAVFVLSNEGPVSGRTWYMVTDENYFCKLGTNKWRSYLFAPWSLRSAIADQKPLFRPPNRDIL